MGCVSSKPDINDQHPNIFQVMNVNDKGDLISPGQLEVTETELVLHQRAKNPTIWPLKSLRKYGFDSGIFSFECGRRCPTGHGFYAFQCRKAEQLFNIVQHHIVRHSNEETTNSSTPIGVLNSNEFPLSQCTIPRRVSSQQQQQQQQQPEGYLNPVAAPIRPHPALSRPGSITSNGPVSPTAASPPPDLEHNNNKRTSLISDRQYTNLNEIETVQPSYVNVCGGLSSTNSIKTADNYVNVLNEAPCHLYMNVDTTATTTTTKEDSALIPLDDKHCYANINAKDLEHLKPLLNTDGCQSVPQTPTSPYITIAQEVNYAELDLGEKKVESALCVPESPKKSYATIDFQKTNALSQSINPSIDVEEGSRKTRHNSTISDATRHSNSLSD